MILLKLIKVKMFIHHFSFVFVCQMWIQSYYKNIGNNRLQNLPWSFFSVSQNFCSSVKYLSRMNTFERPSVAMMAYSNWMAHQPIQVVGETTHTRKEVPVVASERDCAREDVVDRRDSKGFACFQHNSRLECLCKNPRCFCAASRASNPQHTRTHTNVYGCEFKSM